MKAEEEWKLEKINENQPINGWMKISKTGWRKKMAENKWHVNEDENSNNRKWNEENTKRKAEMAGSGNIMKENESEILAAIE